MITDLKALVVVLAIAAVIFRLAKPIALRFSSEHDFSRRRKVWFVLTVVAFLSPNFWLFALVAIPIMTWAGRKDTNPVAFYLLLLHVIPDVPVNIPAIGVKELFALSNYRLLSFCVLIPTAWRLRRSNAATKSRGTTAVDYLLLAFGLLQILIYVPADLPSHVLVPDSATNVLRRAFLFFVDVYVLYYVVSRTCTNKGAIAEAMATFWLASAVMALIAVFESMRHWLLYTDIVMSWADAHPGWHVETAYSFMRSGSVRAQASAGHALALGFLLAIAFGFWLYLRSRLESTWSRIAGALVLWFGLVASFSRGPWIGAAAIYFAFAALGARAFSRLFKATLIATFVIGALSLTPPGERLINTLPFLGGTVDSDSVLYRHRLAERSWELIQQHPLLGDPHAYLQMEDLRQGEGIIDLVNTYAEIALFYGLIGLSLFVGFFLIALFKAYRLAKTYARTDPDAALLGRSLFASILGVLLMLENSSLTGALPILVYVLIGLAGGYARLGRSTERKATLETHLAGSRKPR
jgi:hypothetical protein